MELGTATYRFGPFELDGARRALEKSGLHVPLPSRAFDLLLVLIEGRDRVLSRTEIMRAVWPDVVVEEHNLSVQISTLRRLLGDDGRSPGIIATVPGRGYRFVAQLEPALDDRPVIEPPPATAERPPEPRWKGRTWAGAAFGLTCLAGLVIAFRPGPQLPSAPPLSVVVMPLRDLSDMPGQTYLADAISDDLTTDLAHLPGSTVIARETADSYKGRSLPATEIGHALHVRYLLEGSLRAEGATLHVNAQLISTRDGNHLWAQRFDVPKADLDGVREVIVRRIASALDVQLVQAESTRARIDRPRNANALDLFFQARSILDHDDSLAGFNGAKSLLERALALQPDFADALAELGTTLLRKIASLDDADEVADMREAQAAIAHALALSPGNPRALAARAQALFLDNRREEARYAAQASLAVDPNDLAALGVLARCASAQGRLDEAAAALDTILRLNPDGASNKSRLLQLGYIRLLQGRAPESIDLLNRAAAGDPEPRPGMDSWGRAEGIRMLLIAARMLNGEGRRAEALYLSYARLWPRRTVWRISANETKPTAQLPGFAAFLGALHAAGMPAFADEHADDHLPASPEPLPINDFAATPLSVPGAETIDTPRLATMIRDTRPMLILDLGPGAAVPQGAAWHGQTSGIDDNAFVSDATAHMMGDGRKPIIVMGDGTYGSRPYNAVLHLLAAGYRQVMWYRGGEEAWSAQHQPAADLRD